MSDENEKAPGASELTKDELKARRLLAFEMFAVKRMTRDAIAKELGISAHTAGVDIKAVLRDRSEKAREIAQNVKFKQDSIFEAIITKWLPIALGELPQGEISDHYSVEDRIALVQAGATATDKVVSVLREQAKLHGFHVPKPLDPKDAGKAIGAGMFEAMNRLAGGKVIEAQVIEPKKLIGGVEESELQGNPQLETTPPTSHTNEGQKTEPTET